MPARVGVVGAGWWAGTAHLPALRDSPDAELVGVCDVDVDRAQRAADQFGAQHAVREVGDLLALQLDAVLVATHHNDHYAPAAAAIDAGVDVCVEKPFTIASWQAWDLVARARRRGVNLHVGYTFPYSTPAQALRAGIAAGDLGHPRLVSSLFATSVGHLYADPNSPYSDPESGGQLLTQLTHAVSLVLWLTGWAPESVVAMDTPDDPTRADVADAMVVRFQDGALGTFASSGSLADQDRRIEEYRFFGTDGHAMLNTHTGEVTVLRNDRPAETLPAVRREMTDSLSAPSRALVATALGRAPVVVPGVLGARTVDVLEAARRSMHSGRVVAVASEGRVDV